MRHVAPDGGVRGATRTQVGNLLCQEEQFSPDTGDETQGRSPGILVIEDERLLRKAMGEGLQKQGFEVWVAGDGSEGVELYRRFGAQIDVVLSDVRMPVLDGPKMLDVLREINPSVRCCFMTGDTRPTLLACLMAKRPEGLFIKPFSVYEVGAVLREAIGRSGEQRTGGTGTESGGMIKKQSETQGKRHGNTVESELAERSVPSMLRALIDLGGEWSSCCR